MNLIHISHKMNTLLQLGALHVCKATISIFTTRRKRYISINENQKYKKINYIYVEDELFVPVFEEILFRYILPKCLNYFSVRNIVHITSFSSGILCLVNTDIPFIYQVYKALYAVILGYICYRQNNILKSILVHLFHKLINNIITFYIKRTFSF